MTYRVLVKGNCVVSGLSLVAETLLGFLLKLKDRLHTIYCTQNITILFQLAKLIMWFLLLEDPQVLSD